MKAPAFAYAKPRSLEEACALLEEHGDKARILAGGQSLVPMLNLRVSAPELLVDITGIEGLAGIAVGADKLCIGALTRHREIEQSAEIDFRSLCQWHGFAFRPPFGQPRENHLGCRGIGLGQGGDE